MASKSNDSAPLFERLTKNARDIISKSSEIAHKNYYKEVEALHVFLAILESKNSFINDILEKFGIDTVNTITSIRQELLSYKANKGDIERSNTTLFSKEIKEIINSAFKAASEVGQVHIGTEHLLLAIFKSDASFIKDISNTGLDSNAIEKVIANMTNNTSSDMYNNDSDEDDDFSEETPYFTTDMNAKAEEGKYPVISGRDDEIDRLIHILSRKTKNNPILVGDAGVGKTAIIEGFVKELIAGKLPSSFKNKKVWNLDISSILSGARLRGDVEERIQSVLDTVMEDGNIILFIDEIHTIVGAGSVGGKDSMDIANILKPHLTSSDISVIGATTHDEYVKYFESDSALARRFQPIMVDELSEESAIEVIKRLKPGFEKYHGVKIKDDAVEESVKLSRKYIQDRYLPDKAIDVLDESSARIKIGREKAISPEINKLGEKLIDIQNKKEKYISKANMQKAHELKKEESELITEIEDIISGKKKVEKKYTKTVTESLIRETIVNMTKIPIVSDSISNKNLLELPSKLKEDIVGQDHVIDNTAKAIQRSHLGLTDTARPLASFLFLGPTGVGKTKLAKSIAKQLFGSEELIYQVDMSEFMEMHSVSKLIGSPPGYVGFSEGGQLTTFVRRKPYSVILFDEIEKAHPDTLNILLQLLEEGQLTDSQGRTVSFRNTIIIMTSNIGAEKVSTDGSLGFNVVNNGEEAEELEGVFKDMKEKILEELRYNLRPELINRIDLIDVFRGINKKDSLEITKIEINNLKLNLLKNSSISLSLEPDVEEFINNEGYSKEYGGRNIRRKVIEIIENSIASFLITKDIKRKKGKILKLHGKIVNKEFTVEKTK